MKSSPWSIPLLAGIATALLVAGAGTANADDQKASSVSSSSSAELLDSTETEAALIQQTDDTSLILPTGTDWPTTVPSFMENPDAQYEEGVVTAVTTFYWLCAWEKSYLLASDQGDTKLASSSLAQIAKFPRTPFYIAQFVDPEDGWRKTILNPASAGDSSGVRAHFAGGDCGFFSEINPS